MFIGAAIPSDRVLKSRNDRLMFRSTMSFRQSTVSTLLVALAFAVLPGPSASAMDPAVKTRLGIRDARFVINGKPGFLLGCSYYGALGASDEFWAADLDGMQRAGMNWVRVWATWAANGHDVSAVDGQTGEPREPGMARLRQFVKECDRRGLIVDVTLSRGNGATGPARLQNLSAHDRAVRSIVTALKPSANWYLDLANERSVQDKRFVSFEELKSLREMVRELDPDRLVTASHGSDISDEDLLKYATFAQLDFVTPHRPRTAESSGQTADICRRALQVLKDSGKPIPIHFQEPFRRGYRAEFNPSAADFEADLRGALRGGAAGWCFHNGESFDLRNRSLFSQFDDVQRQIVDQLKNVVKQAE